MVNVRERTTFLSESVGGRNIRVHASLTEDTLVHEVPSGEVHAITMYAVNVGTAPNEVTGFWGSSGSDDVLDFTIPAESTGPALIRDAILEGPASIVLRAKIVDVFVFGKVETFKDVTP